MVERLKIAIEKARARRAEHSADAPRRVGPGHLVTDDVTIPQMPSTNLPAERRIDMNSIEEIRLAARALERMRIASGAPQNARTSDEFDIFRARLLKLCRRNNWTRIAITAPTRGCGSTTIALNLAFSLARSKTLRTLLVDMNLSVPAIADRLGIVANLNLPGVLTGSVTPETLLRRVGTDLAVAANTRPVHPSKLPDLFAGIQYGLSILTDSLAPDITVLDLPAVLDNEDVAEVLKHVDATVLVASADRSTAPEIDAAARLLSEHTAYLGVLLNRASKRSRSGADYVGA